MARREKRPSGKGRTDRDRREPAFAGAVTGRMRAPAVLPARALRRCHHRLVIHPDPANPGPTRSQRRLSMALADPTRRQSPLSRMSLWECSHYSPERRMANGDRSTLSNVSDARPDAPETVAAKEPLQQKMPSEGPKGVVEA